jgi:ankyrin repeat protein
MPRRSKLAQQQNKMEEDSNNQSYLGQAWGAVSGFSARVWEWSIHNAITSKKQDMVVNFVNNGTDRNLPDNAGDTPLHLAIKTGQPDIAMYLVEKGANVNVQDKEGNTPLHLAALSGHVPLTEMLLERGANIKAKNDKGERPLHSAVQFKPTGPVPKNLHMAHLGATPKLIRWGAKIEKRDERGYTPVKKAAELENLSMVEVLVDHGARDPYEQGVQYMLYRQRKLQKNAARQQEIEQAQAASGESSAPRKPPRPGAVRCPPERKY